MTEPTCWRPPSDKHGGIGGPRLLPRSPWRSKPVLWLFQFELVSKRALCRRPSPEKPEVCQSFTGEFPTYPNREFISPLQGIKSDDQGSLRPYQGKRGLARVLPDISRAEARRPRVPTRHLPVNPARRNASTITSPLPGTVVFRPALRRGLSGSVGTISA
jgi:hypothetical protein